MNTLSRIFFALLLSLSANAYSAPAIRAAGGVSTINFTVDGTARTALLYVPPGVAALSATAKRAGVPLVFVFHGHGGNARSALNQFRVNQLWPEAISIYPEGLPTPGLLTDPNGVKRGWQSAVGDQGDRDLRFFDAMLARLKSTYPVDAKRIYCTGHSNGGGFTYLLWLARPAVFAAVAPSSAAAKYAQQLTPKPALIAGGRNDPLVKPAWQQLTMTAVRKVNGCDKTGVPWEKGGTLYPSKTGTPLVTFIHDGGHTVVPGEVELFVKFFHQHPLP